MAPDFAEVLRVDGEQARINADFFESYANTALSQAGALESGAPGRFASPAELATDDAEWRLRMAAASALRTAGQWATLADPSRAAELLATAGTVFTEAGHYGFGSFLLSVSGSRPPFEPPSGIAMLLSLNELRGETADLVPEIPEAMHQPQQQAYLLLSLAARSAELRDERNIADLHTLCDTSPHRDGNVPVGALGAPIRHYWAIARSLLDTDPEQFLRHYVAAFQSRYLEDMESARANRHLWANGAAPVDVLDIDAIGMATLWTRFLAPVSTPLSTHPGAQHLMSAPLWALLSIGERMATALDDEDDEEER